MNRFAAAVLWLGVASLAGAHEPVFAPGPHVPGQGIIGFDNEYTLENQRGGSRNARVTEQGLENYLHYGPTPDSEVGVKIRTMDLSRTANYGASGAGLADLGLQAKDRFWRRDRLGAQTGAAWVAETVLPTGDESRGLGRGSYGLRVALTLGTERLVHSGWVAAEYSIKDLYVPYTRRAEWGGQDVRLGAIYGLRFYQPRDFKDWDFPVYISVHYENESPERRYGAAVPDTGRQFLSVGPSILPSKRNLMFRFGVQWPLWQQLRGDPPRMNYQLKFVLEKHI